jgi:hypothetical protein
VVEAGSLMRSAMSLRLASPSASASTRSSKATRATVPVDVDSSVEVVLLAMPI